MAAGLGFKDFTTGEVLTAADVDGYLMQGIWVFASAAARDAAVTSPQEGNACYLKDTDVIQVYTGSSWAAQSASNPISANIVDAKGDIIAATAADTVSRLAVGANDTVLTADSSTATGLKWATPSSSVTFVGCSLYKNANQTINNATNTAISFQVESYDTDAFHDNSTNNTRITIPAGKAGKYLVTGSIAWSTGANERIAMIYKNGVLVNYMHQMYPDNAGGYYAPFNYVINLAVGDYIELFCNQGSGGSLTVYNGLDLTTFQASYLGA